MTDPSSKELAIFDYCYMRYWKEIHGLKSMTVNDFLAAHKTWEDSYFETWGEKWK